MAVVALTPRVRTIVICDEVFASLTEDDVFALEGVRYSLGASWFPWRKALSVFLLLSSPRRGKYKGRMLIVSDRTDKAIRYVNFVAAFQEDNELLPLWFDVGDCLFPEAGQYNFEIYFSARDGGEALKGEHPFIVLSYEE